MQVLGGVAHRLGTGPNRTASGSENRETATVITAEMATMATTVWVKIFSAFSWSPCPRAKAHRVEVPMESRDGRTGQDVDKRKGDVDAGQGQLAHALGDKDTVHDGIGREKAPWRTRTE